MFDARERKNNNNIIILSLKWHFVKSCSRNKD